MSISRKLGITTPNTWGSRSQLAGMNKELADIKGNRDGIWDNEQKAPDSHGNLFERNPLFSKLNSMFDAGFSVNDEIESLQTYRVEQEQKWGQSTTNVPLSKLKNGELFAAQKAMTLDRLGRTPADVTEGFVQASGRVDGHKIQDRELFYQRFRPRGEPSGKVIVLSPGFQETGRNFLEQIDKMNQEGHDVIVMDHQWAGQSEGSSGGMDRGFGVARDVAAMTAFAQQVATDEYGQTPNAEVVLFGNSMGAGPGVLGAILMNDNGRVELDGPPMPKGVKAVLQAPFLKASPTLTNDVIGLASKLPLLNRIQAPSAGVPVINSNKIGGQKGAQSAVLEDVRAQLRTMSAAENDIDTMFDMLEGGLKPQGKIFIVHGDEDTLADSAGSQQLKELLGDQVELKMIHSTNHVLEQNPGEQDHALEGLKHLLRQ